MQVTYTRSEESVKKIRSQAMRKSRAQRYIWKAIKDDHPELFEALMEQFNATQDEPYEVKS